MTDHALDRTVESSSIVEIGATYTLLLALNKRLGTSYHKMPHMRYHLLRARGVAIPR
jgi:hypothetical protein